MSWYSPSPISMTDTDKRLEVSEPGRDARRNHPRQSELRGLDALDAYVIEQRDGYSIATGFHTSNSCYFISVQTPADKWKLAVDHFSWLNHNCQRS